MKKLTIIKIEYLERGKKGWYNPTKELELLQDYTPSRIKKELEERNKKKRSNFWTIYQQFDLSRKKDCNAFINYLLNNKKELNEYQLDTLKQEALKIINNL